jgi:outer membrane protein OmpA-like peptidoglycan-associated protein
MEEQVPSRDGCGRTRVGHTDPRGSQEYNNGLGMRRAEVTRDYLTSKGVASNDITLESRDEQDAKGDSPAAWQLDRRVKVDESSAHGDSGLDLKPSSSTAP